MKHQAELEFNYLLLAGLLMISMALPFLPAVPVFTPVAKIWSSPSIRSFQENYRPSNAVGYLSVATFKPAGLLEAGRVSTILFLAIAIWFVFGICKLLRDLRSLYQVKKTSFLVRRIGAVRIYINDEIKVPFSYWTPSRANVFVPSYLVASGRYAKIAIAHELQHHRQADTRWIYALQVLKLACCLNPCMHIWSRRILEIQEFACDEILVDRNKVNSRDYASCLVEVAQTAIQGKYVPACATGLTFRMERHTLKGRIENMLKEREPKTKRSVTLAFGALLLSLTTATALGSRSAVQDRRVTMHQAMAMAKVSNSKTQFPIAVNDLVLAQLNRYLGTPEGREFMKDSLQRMENYRTLVEGKIHQYSVPIELMAIPIVESGYQNLADSKHAGWGAGLWMFIAPTARAFGLKVDSRNDERMNTELLTDAAMRYLQLNYLRFKNWQLAILAYNVGEQELQHAMDKTGAKDAWSLIRQGYENDEDYLPRVMAAILIMENPELLK